MKKIMKRWGVRFLGIALALATVVTSLNMSTVTTQAEELPGTEKQYVIVLDPGHGGADTGAGRVFNGLSYCECDINLMIANYCKATLETYPNVTVYMTRTDNTSACMDRQQRVQFAKDRNADALISFHINSTGADVQYDISGATVFYQNGNYNGEVSRAGYNMSVDILSELQNVGVRNNGAVTRESHDTKCPDGSTTDYLGINYYSKLQGFPGILIEHAFVNNPNDCASYFTTQEQLASLGAADARGIMNCINNGRFEYRKVGHWYLDNNGWWYAYAEGGYAANTWEQINGKWYYFDGAGYMRTGWLNWNGQWYYLNGDGSMAVSNWVLSNGVWYYLTGSGAMATGWAWDGSHWYFMNSSGAMMTGWILDNNTWYFMNNSGAMVSNGWVWSGRAWYYMTGSGAMAANGWIWDGSHWYDMNGDGTMKTGWLWDGANWFYLSGSGSMATGWQKVNGVWYFLYDSGNMAANTWIGNYYVNSSGAWTNSR